MTTSRSRSMTFLIMFMVACGVTACAVDEDAPSLDDPATSTEALTGCTAPATVLVYTQDGFEEIADALAADPSPCANYYISLPALSNDKTQPRGPLAPQHIRARGRQLHALAEFHWGGWHDWVAAHPNEGWYGAGREFRRRMVDAGYDTTLGDSWAINEAPSTLRSDPQVRANLRAAVRGLYEGPSGAPVRRGAVFTEGMGSQLQNFSQYKPNIEDLLSDDAFWHQMDLHVLWWGQEVYARPAEVCVAGASLATQAAHVNTFTTHEPRVAVAGGDASSAAAAYLRTHWVPLLNAAYRSSAYGTEDTSLSAMMHFVSTQVYATRAWAPEHTYPGRRIGLAWVYSRDVVTPDAEQQLATRVASSLHHAYDRGGGSAMGACSPTGADTWCTCGVAGAQFNDLWNTFSSW